MERRTDKRVPYLAEVKVEGLAGETSRSSRIADLSIHGAFVESPTVAPEGTKVHLEFTVGHTNIQVQGEIRYSVPQIGMGVRFLDLDAEGEKAIQTLVKNLESA